MSSGNGKATTPEELQAIVAAYEKLPEDDPAKATLRGMFERLGFVQKEPFNTFEALRSWLDSDTRAGIDVEGRLTLFDAMSDRVKLLCSATIVMWKLRDQMTESKWATLLQYARDVEALFGKEVSAPAVEAQLPLTGTEAEITKAEIEPSEEEQMLSEIQKLTGYPVDCRLVPELHAAFVKYHYLPFRQENWETRTMVQERGRLEELKLLALRAALRSARLDHDRERAQAMLRSGPG